MRKEKTTKSKKSLIAETITLYTANSLSFEDLIDNIVQGDNLTVLRLIPDNSINLIITSPPYFKQMKKGFTIIKIKGEPIKRDVIECAVETIKGSKHPAIYPLFIVKELIKLLSRPDDIVLDPFIGDGKHS